jgi:glycerol-3-phosphate dehydrogenase
VVNATGPHVRVLARQSDRDLPALFRPTLAFNLLLNRPPLAELALAVQPPQRGAQVYFVLPWKGRLLAGTCYAGLPEATLEPKVTESQVRLFLDELNAAVSGLDLAPREVSHVYAGLLPGRRAGTTELATEAIVHDHGRHGGPQGLYSVSGVKFTTARQVAEATLRAMFGRELRACRNAPERPQPLLDLAGQTLLSTATPFDGEARALESLLHRIAREEAVMYAEDLLLRRLDSTSMLVDQKASDVLRRALAPLLPGLTDHHRSAIPPVA